MLERTGRERSVSINQIDHRRGTPQRFSGSIQIPVLDTRPAVKIRKVPPCEWQPLLLKLGYDKLGHDRFSAVEEQRLKCHGSRAFVHPHHVSKRWSLNRRREDANIPRWVT